MKGRIRMAATVVGCSFALIAPGQASAAIYTQIDGMTGDVVVEGYEGAIDTQSMQFGIGRPAKDGSKPSLSDIVMTKQLDPATTELMARATTGTTIPAATISFVRTVEGGPELYLRYCLTGVRVAGWSTSSGGERPSESVSLSYATLVTRNIVQGANGTSQTLHFGWDVLRVLQYGAGSTC